VLLILEGLITNGIIAQHRLSQFFKNNSVNRIIFINFNLIGFATFGQKLEV